MESKIKKLEEKIDSTLNKNNIILEENKDLKNEINNLKDKTFDLKEKISKNDVLDYVEVTECLIILTILSSNSKKIQDIIDNLDILKDTRYYATSIIGEKERVFLKSLNIDILYYI